MYTAPKQANRTESAFGRLRWHAGSHPRARSVAGLLAVTLALAGLSFARPVSAGAASAGVVIRLTPKAMTSLAGAGIRDRGSDSGADDESVLQNNFQQGNDQLREPSVLAPKAAAAPVLAAVTPGGFDGISQLEQLQADPGHQRGVGPPDQALCAGNGYVLEGVNLAVRVDSPAGTPLTGAVAISQLMGDGPEVISTDPLVLGHLHSDPRCLFDADTGRFFVTAMRYQVDPQTHDLIGRAAIEIAVSNGPDPRGTWDVYALDATADSSDPAGAIDGCPCYGDFPSLGADANGIYTGYNLYTDASNFDIGKRLVAISKHQLTE